MTNEPSLEKQNENLDIIKSLDAYNIDNVPGGAKSENRFVRASFISENMPEASTAKDAVNYMFAAADSVSVPFVKGYKDEDFTKEGLQDKWPTQWKSVISMKNKILYITDVLVGNRVFVDLSEANLQNGQPVKSISIMSSSLVGDLTDELTSKK